jgi:hypothetical protein
MPIDERSWWSAIMRWGYALWFVVALGLLGFLAGWQLDRAAPRAHAVGRVLFTVAGAATGAMLGWGALLRRRA